jgi:cell division protease FtsH
MFNKNDNDSRPPADGRDNRPNLRGLAVFISIFLLFGALWTWQAQNRAKVQEISYQAFREKLDAGQIHNGAVNYDSEQIQEITGIIQGRNPQGKEVEMPFRLRHRVTENLSEELAKAGFAQRTGNAFLSQLLLAFLPMLLFLGIIWLFFWRQVRSAGKSTFSFGKSRARMLSRDKNRVTFKDVAGIQEAKEEVQEVVEFLKDPKKFQRLGGRIPKGALMIGPPGTGKTLLAKAIAGEAEVPFFSISGSDFVEMFVGVGASRVRDMFEQARKHAPCLIFIDEIDAVGRSRFSGIGGGHDEREQTLNALLVEMDGFDSSEGIIIIAATNRPDVLDPALRRPGRFDREIAVDLPDVNEREQILKIHVRNIKLAKEVDLKIIARGTPGFSGADLSNLCNEAALIAAKNNKKSVAMEELEAARDKVCWGRERRSKVMDEKDKKVTAYHEAGHALIQAVLDKGDYPVHRVTIIPRGQSLGSTMYLPQRDKYTQSRKELEIRLATIMGGRIAEEMIFSDITSGAANDIKQATAIARKMVCEWGMSDKLGAVHYGQDNDEPVFLGRELVRAQHLSESTSQAVDEEIRRFTDAAYNLAKQILTEKKDRLIAIADALLEYETLDGEQVLEIIRTGKMTEPPPRDEQPPVPPVVTPPPVEVAKVPPPLPGTPGIEEAPANA